MRLARLAHVAEDANRLHPKFSMVDPIGRPAEFGGSVGEGILSISRFSVLSHLMGGRLAEVNDGQTLKVPGLDLVRENESAACRSTLTLPNFPSSS
jgi:hypothetical protein